LAQLEAWFAVADSNFMLSGYYWTSQFSLHAELTNNHVSIDLYHIKVQYLASSAKLYLAAKFQVPHKRQLIQMSSSPFACEVGVYLLLSFKGDHPQTAMVFHPVSLPVRLSCTNGNSLFDIKRLEILNTLTDDCDSTNDLTFQDQQCSQYRTVTSSMLQSGLQIRITVELRQLNSHTSNITFNQETLKFKANLADLTSQSISPNGIQFKGQDLQIDGRLN